MLNVLLMRMRSQKGLLESRKAGGSELGPHRSHHFRAAVPPSREASQRSLVSCRSSFSTTHFIIVSPPRRLLHIIMSFNYRTIVDGRGYRFTLPFLGLPDPYGDWVLIEVATSSTDLEMLKVPSKPINSSQLPSMRFPSGDCKTVSVKHDAAIWKLPVLGKAGDDDPAFFTVKAKRVPAATAEAALDEAKAGSKSKASRNHAASAGKEIDADLRSLVSTLAATKLGNRSKPSTSKTASSPHTSSTASSSDPVHDTSAASSSSSSDSEDDSSSSSNRPSPSRRGPERPSPSKAPKTKPACSDGLCTGCHNHMGASRANYRFDSEVDYDMNEIFKHRLRWTKYVDVLPKGDRVPIKITKRESYRKHRGSWCVNLEERTIYHLTSTPTHTRTMGWRALTRNQAGLPCTIAGNILGIDLGQPRLFVMLLTGVQLADGPALLKVVPKPAEYACQPLGASAEASYFLNRFKLVVKQKGRQSPACEPLARLVTINEEAILSTLAQWAMLESSSPSPSANKMVYSSIPGPSPGLGELLNVGIRLRDGGARLPIICRGGATSRKRIKMPGVAFFHALFGDDELLWKLMDRPKSERGEEMIGTREVNLRVVVPTSGPHDLLLRVVDQADGLFEELQYAVRPQGSFKPVRESEWKRMEVPLVDEWVVSFFLNVARESFGHLENHV